MRDPSTLQIALDVRRATRDGSEAIKTRQQARLNDLVAHARQHSRFYAERYRGLPDRIDDARQLPVVSKPELMARFDDWIADPALTRKGLEAFVADKANIGKLYLDRYLVCTTSGTTGTPAILVQDPLMLRVVGMLNVMRATPAWLTRGDLMRILKARARTAVVWATDGHFLGISMAKRQIYERPSRAKSIRAFSMLTPLPELVQQLNAFQPAMLNGYATAVSLLAQEQEAGRLNIHPVLVMTSSESLAPAERDRIAAAFGAKVRDNYGCSEFVAIAYNCGHGWLHVHADWVILEPVDENLQPAPPGQPSQSVLLTNLANHAQPIIRYNLGDRIVVNPEPCACGSSLPAIRVEGRTDDILRFARPDGAGIPILPLALWSVIKETPGVYRFQAIQIAPDRLKVRLETKSPGEEVVWDALNRRVSDFLIQQGLGNVIVERASKPPVRDPKSGKFRHVWAELK
jgi:phenylacetate-coenzyme A ligase PaaK-like adenylate-forming protein